MLPCPRLRVIILCHAALSAQIGEVNEMFQDLAVLINDQGVQVAHSTAQHSTA